jgi:Flp pilus assembly protein TadB
MTFASVAPMITFAMVMVIGAALRPVAPRNVGATAGVPNAARPFGAAATLRALTRRRQPVVDAMAAATWCDELARAVRAGATLTAALRAGTMSAGVQPVVGSICLSLDRGQLLADALRPVETDSPHLDVALTVLRACAQHGGPAAEPLDRAAATLRARAADHADRLTQSAQARMSAAVMTCLPVAMLALMTITSRSVRGAVVSPVGLLAIGVGAILNVSGWLWMRRTINRDTMSTRR